MRFRRLCSLAPADTQREFQEVTRCAMPARLPGIILYESHTLALALGLPAVAAATLEGGADGRRSSLGVREGSGDREGGMARYAPGQRTVIPKGPPVRTPSLQSTQGRNTKIVHSEKENKNKLFSPAGLMGQALTSVCNAQKTKGPRAAIRPTQTASLISQAAQWDCHGSLPPAPKPQLFKIAHCLSVQGVFTSFLCLLPPGVLPNYAGGRVSGNSSPGTRDKWEE